jgi:hypothetical protein
MGYAPGLLSSDTAQAVIAGVTGLFHIRAPSGGGGLMEVDTSVVATFFGIECAVVIGVFLLILV